MYIEELKEEVEDFVSGEEKSPAGGVDDGGVIVASDAKRVLVGAGARALFYPTLLYNVVRNKIQTEFRWWDRVDEFVLLGAVPFPTDVPRLKELGVCGVVTLNEPYETLVPTALYHAHDIDHLVIPTRDYLFAPSYSDICKAVDFIHENASCGKTTYVHCKAGRGRSTTIVLCYLAEHKNMTPDAAYEYVRSIRPRVLLASSQRQAVQDYYSQKVKKPETDTYPISCVQNTSLEPPSNHACDDDFDDDFEDDFEDDGSVVVITEEDLDGYDESCYSDLVSGSTSMAAAADGSLACKVQCASQAAIGRLSCLWLRSHGQKLSRKRLGSSVGTSTDQLGNIGVDISVC